MDAKLKDALIDKIHIAQDELKSPRAVKALLEDLRVQRAEKCAPNAQKMLYSEVRRKLVDRRLWTPIHEGLAQQGFAAFVRKLAKIDGAEAATKEFSAARERQLALFPGFEALPTRIRSGPGYLNFPETTVSQFLAYESKYQARATRDNRTAEELHRLAETVRPFAEQDFSVAQAFARASAEPAKLSLVQAK